HGGFHLGNGLPDVESSLLPVLGFQGIQEVLQKSGDTALAVPIGVSAVLVGHSTVLPRVEGREAHDLAVEVHLVGPDELAVQVVVERSDTGEDCESKLGGWRQEEE